MDLTDAPSTSGRRDAGASCAVGARTHWEVGGPVAGRRDRGARARRASCATSPPTSPSRSARARRSPSSTPCSPSTARSARSIRAIRTRRSAASLACGLSGIRRLRHGPLRDHVLEVRFVTADGRLVKGGGPTVKNVTGYDLPRLLVGSFGTLGVLVQVTLRCRPARRAPRSGSVDRRRRDALYRAVVRCCGTDGTTHVLLEGVAADVDAQARGLDAVRRPPALPDGAHRGRISVAPGALARARPRARPAPACAGAPSSASAPCTSPPTTPTALAAARARRARARRLDAARGGRRPASTGSAAPLPNAALMRRIKDAFDPDRQARARADCRCEPSAIARRDRLRPRRGRARRVRRVRAVPAALPDVPRHRPRDRVAARADRGDARGRARRRADRRRVPRRDGRVRAVPRLRGRVPVVACRSVTSWRTPAPRCDDHGARRARSRRVAGVGRATGRCCRVTRLLLALTWVAARSRNGCASCRAGSALPRSRPAIARDAARRAGRRRPDAWLLHRVRDGRVAARHAPGDGRGSCARPARASARPGAAATAAARCTSTRAAIDEARAARAPGDRVDARRRAGRRRTARAAARR